MTPRRLNHAVLYVSDVERSVAFYHDVLGLEPMPQAFPGVAFLRAAGSANDHDLGLFPARSPRPTRQAPGLFHLAWEIGTLIELAAIRDALAQRNALSGASDHVTTKAVYGVDPDGIELEACWLVPDERVPEALAGNPPPPRPLDLDAEMGRYGDTTPSGPRRDPGIWASPS